jgi:hypothetical protein
MTDQGWAAQWEPRLVVSHFQVGKKRRGLQPGTMGNTTEGGGQGAVIRELGMTVNRAPRETSTCNDRDTTPFFLILVYLACLPSHFKNPVRSYPPVQHRDIPTRKSWTSPANGELSWVMHCWLH